MKTTKASILITLITLTNVLSFSLPSYAHRNWNNDFIEIPIYSLDGDTPIVKQSFGVKIGENGTIKPALLLYKLDYINERNIFFTGDSCGPNPFPLHGKCESQEYVRRYDKPSPMEPVSIPSELEGFRLEYRFAADRDKQVGYIALIGEGLKLNCAKVYWDGKSYSTVDYTDDGCSLSMNPEIIIIGDEERFRQNIVLRLSLAKIPAAG